MRAVKEAEHQEKMEKWKRRKRRRLIILGIVLFLILAAVFFCLTTRITSVSVTGNTRYTEEELISMIMKEDKDWNTVYAIYKDRFEPHVDIPFIEKYSVKITGLHSAKITVYEKSLAGCVEYMGTYLYFDKDGVIVESSSETTPLIPVVTGLRFQNIVMYEKLTVEDEAIFGRILNLSQALSGYELQVDRIDFDQDGKVTLYLGGLKVVLGEEQYMADKISEFHDMYPQLKDLEGTLYLDEYSPDAKNPSYPFVKNP